MTILVSRNVLKFDCQLCDIKLNNYDTFYTFITLTNENFVRVHVVLFYG